MRKLNKKQKKLLKEWFEQNKDKVGVFFDSKDLPTELYHKVVNLNDHETIHQNMTRFLSDLGSNEMYG